jgi:hypothetical protein
MGHEEGGEKKTREDGQRTTLLICCIFPHRLNPLLEQMVVTHLCVVSNTPRPINTRCQNTATDDALAGARRGGGRVERGGAGEEKAGQWLGEIIRSFHAPQEVHRRVRGVRSIPRML